MKHLLIVPVLLAASESRADVVSITPVIGGEFVSGGTATLSLQNGAASTTLPASFGLAYGGHLTLDFGGVSIGALYQRTEMVNDRTPGLNYNKLYFEMGGSYRASFVALGGSIAGGWAFFSANSTQRQDGIGGRVSIFADFYIADWFSIGPGASFDFAGYFVSGGLYGTYGFTCTARLGLHF